MGFPPNQKQPSKKNRKLVNTPSMSLSGTPVPPTYSTLNATPLNVFTTRFSMNTVTQIQVGELCELTQLRPFPDTASRLLVTSKDPSSTMMDLTDIISGDPVLSMQILKLANSCTYGLTAQIGSIQHAGVIIGLRALKNLAISMLVGGMFESGDSQTSAARQQLLDHSMLTACIAKRICAVLPGSCSDEAFLGGMLHDIGKLILADYRPSEFSAVMQQSCDGHSVEIESKSFGTNHVTVGEACCETWGLPGTMIDIVADHHHPTTHDQCGDLLAVTAGNVLSRSWKHLTQEELDQVLSRCSQGLSGALPVEQLKTSVQEEIDTMTEIRASR